MWWNMVSPSRLLSTQPCSTWQRACLIVPPHLDAALKLVLAITYQYHHLQQKQERVEEVPVKSEAIKVPAEPAKAPEPIQTACVALPVPAAPPAAAVPAPAPPAPAAPPLPTAPQQQVAELPYCPAM